MAETYELMSNRHRPKILEQVVGQEHAVDQIRGMFIDGKIARSILISGPWGCGKTTFARIIARYLNCTKFDTINCLPCEDDTPCPSCAAMAKGAHPDVNEMNAADTRGIDDVRALLGQSTYAPRYSYRIYILDECHQLTPQAMQSLLKKLEEPSKRTVFILATTNPEKLPGAIPSRCQKLTLKRPTVEAVAGLLKQIAIMEGIKGIKDEQFETIAKLTRMHPRDAIQVLESVFIRKKVGTVEDQATFEKIVEAEMEAPPLHYIFRYLFYVYKGMYVGALRVLRNYSSQEILLATIIEYHTQALFKLMSAKLITDEYGKPFSEYADFYKMIDEAKLISTLVRDKDEESKKRYSKENGFVAVDFKSLSILSNEFIKTLSKMKEYTVDTFQLMVACTLKCSTIMNSGGENVFNEE